MFKQKAEDADLALIDGAIWTVNTRQPWAEAVAIREAKIWEVGSTDEIMNSVRANTAIVDLRGDMVLPGFIDCHTHFLEGGFSLQSVQLKDVKSKDAFTSRIRERAQEVGTGLWILNGNWDHQQFDPPELPRKEWIDSVTPLNPVCVKRHDGHMVLVNSLSLKLAGITKNTVSPTGGEILKDIRTGEPTGVLKDAAAELMMSEIPEPSFKAKKNATEISLQHALKMGVTSVHDMTFPTNFEVYLNLLRENKLTTRLYIYVPIDELELFKKLKLQQPIESPFLRIGGLKGFVDGSLGSSTALFFEPYADDPEKKGLLYSHMFPEGIMEERLMKAEKARFQVAVHAIGDEANHILLDILEKVIALEGERDRRWRIEHAQHLRLKDMSRIGNLGLIVSAQPSHILDDALWIEKKIGKERSKCSYAYKSLLDKGILLAGGSDWPVASLNPLLGIYAALTRRIRFDKKIKSWLPEQRISLKEAIKIYTLNAAHAEFSEKYKGSVEKGKVADLVVLDQNLFNISPDEIKDAQVKMTILDGKIVYRNENI
jgi:predicted amidohydrolase YtcJ